MPNASREPVGLWHGVGSVLVAGCFLIGGPLRASSDDEPPTPAREIHGTELPEGAVARCGPVRLRHGSSLTSMEFSPKGDLILSAGGPATPILWDVKTGKEVFRIPPLALAPDSAAFINKGAGIVTLGEFGGRGNRPKMRFWELTECGVTLKKTLENVSHATLVVSADGKMIAGAGVRERIVLWDAVKQEEVRRLTWEDDDESDAGGVSVAFSPDGTRIASVTRNVIRFWNVTTGEEVSSYKVGDGKTEVAGLTYSPDGKRLALGLVGGSVRLCEVENGKVVAEWKGPQAASAYPVRFAPDGKLLAVGQYEGSDVFILDGASLKELDHTEFHNWVDVLSFAPDGKRLAVAGRSGVIDVYDLAAKKWLFPFSGHCGGVQSLAFSADDTVLISGGDDGSVCCWDPQTGKNLSALKGSKRKNPILTVAPRDKHVVVAESSGDLRLWDYGESKKVSALGTLDKNADCLAVSSDGKRCAIGLKDGTLILQSLPFGKEAWRIDAHEDRVQSVCFSPDGRYVATAGHEQDNSTICLWDSSDGKQVFRHVPKSRFPLDVSNICFSGDGKRFACALGRELLVWEKAGATKVLSKQFSREEVRYSITAIALSPDGKTVAVAEDKDTVFLVKADSGKTIRTYSGHSGGITGICFAHNGKLFATASADSTILVWKVPE